MDKKEKKVNKNMTKTLQKTKKLVKRSTPSKGKLFEEKENLSRLYVYVVIVDRGQGNSVIKLMQSLGSSLQFTEQGQGTATNELRNILGIIDDYKDVVFSIIDDNKLDSVTKELDSFFVASKKNRGVGFAIPMTSIMGVKFYKFLTQTY